jgi:hypothetical protein
MGKQKEMAKVEGVYRVISDPILMSFPSFFLAEMRDPRPVLAQLERAK